MQNNDDKLPGAEVPPVSDATQARGSFDLRSSVKKKPQDMKYWAIAGVVVVVLLCGLAGLWALALNAMNEGTSDIDESKVQADTMLKGTEGSDDAMRVAREAKARKLADDEESERRKKVEQAKATPASVGGQTPAPQTPSSKPPSQAQVAAPAPMTALERKLAGGVYLKSTAVAASSYGQSTNGTRQSSPSGGSGKDDDAGLLDSGGGSSGSSSGRGSLSNLSGTRFKPSRAVLAPDGKYLLRHNTYASCALYTEVITDQPGLVECRLTEPLYSADGSTVIAEAGAALTGEQKVEVRPGVTRVFTSWTELETSSGTPGVRGVRARLDSLGAGQMGASGTKAWIDNHNYERYSGAVALSLFQDVLAAGVNSTQKSGSGYTVNNSEQNVENMASKALDASINMNPTGYLLPGTILTVIIARDIDFSSVYENR